MDELLDRWEALSQREQIMVAACAVVVVGFVLYLLIQPLFANASSAERRIADKQILLEDIGSYAARQPRGAAPAAAAIQGGGQSLVVVIDRTTRSSGLAGYLKRNQPDGSNGVRVRFEDAPFDEVLAWIAELDQNWGMYTSTASFDRGSATGRVNCNLVLSRPGQTG